MKEQKNEESYIDQLANYFQQHANQFGWILVVVGAVFLYGAIRRWGWLFEGGEGAFNIAWVAETFGPKTAQVLFILLSLLFIGAGLGWVYLF